MRYASKQFVLELVRILKDRLHGRLIGEEGVIGSFNLRVDLQGDQKCRQHFDELFACLQDKLFATDKHDVADRKIGQAVQPVGG